MPRVYHIKKARKDNPVAKKGEEYYWWQNAFRAKQFSKTRPKPSQITGSAFLSSLYGLQEDLEAGFFTDFDSLQSQLDDLAQQLDDLQQECQDSLDNMPEHLQDTSDSGMLLTERIDELESAVSQMQSIEASEEPDDWSDEIQNYGDMNKHQKAEAEEDWRIEKMDDFVQEVIDNFPQL